MTELSADLAANLRTAFLAEAASVQRFTYFAQAAQIEGYLDTARLLNEAAENLACVAHGHLDFLRTEADPHTGLPLGDTRPNLAAAVEGELRDATATYPELALLAHSNGHPDIASWLDTVSSLKKAHVSKLSDLLTGLLALDEPVDQAGNQPAQAER